jgi:hypothetical protein
VPSFGRDIRLLRAFPSAVIVMVKEIVMSDPNLILEAVGREYRLT